MVKKKFSRDRDARFTDILETRAFIGLLYYAGILKANHLNADELWKTDGSGVEIFRLTVSLPRFRFLIRCCRFDNKDTRDDRKKVDKLAPIRDFFDLFVKKCKEGYSLSAFVTIDEKIERFRGKCSFRQYIPSGVILCQRHICKYERDFLRNLSLDLLKPYLHNRVALRAIPVNIKSRIREICGIG